MNNKPNVIRDVVKISKKIINKYPDNYDNIFFEFVRSNAEEQFYHKNVILEFFKNNNSFDNIWIIGPWFGYNFVPQLIQKAKPKNITIIDKFTQAAKISLGHLNKLSKLTYYEKDINFINDNDVKKLDVYFPNIIINLICEHTIPVKNLPIYNNKQNALKIFQINTKRCSNNINEVATIDEFIDQLNLNNILYQHDDYYYLDKRDKTKTFTVIGY